MKKSFIKKSIIYLIIWILTIPFFTWFYKILFSKIDNNDCMLTYVYNIKYNWYKKGYWLENHVDVKKYKWDIEIWKVNWCLFYWSWNPWLNYSNIVYCNLVYSIT